MSAMSQSLEQLLTHCYNPDNHARRQAEEQIENLAKDPQVVPAIIEIMRGSIWEEVRRLSAVLLRQKITGHWMNLSRQVRDSVKSALLESIIADHSEPVRIAGTDVVIVVANHALPAGEWPELLPFLIQCGQSHEKDYQEVALILFRSLTETIGDFLRPHFSTLRTVLVESMQDETSNRVRSAALEAFLSFLKYIETENQVAHHRLLLQQKQYADWLKQHEKVLELARRGYPSTHMVERIWHDVANETYLEWDSTSRLPLQKQQELSLEGKSEIAHDERMKLLSDALDEAAKADNEAPDHLRCKITWEILMDPVVTPSGYTYERAAILEYLRKGNFTDPFTREPLRADQLVPNFAIKEAVQHFLAKHGDLSL